MPNNYDNRFHLPPHLGFIQPACAPPQPFIQQPISRTPIETQQAEKGDEKQKPEKNGKPSKQNC